MTTPTTPRHDLFYVCATRWVFFWLIGDGRLYFNKPATNIDEQLDLFKGRGLVVEDEEKAKYYLEFIGYFRFKGYAIPFQVDPQTHELQEGTTFQDILNLYIFDRKLRLHIMDAVERIEVALKSILSNQLSTKLGCHWYMDQQYFVDEFTEIPEVEEGDAYEKSQHDKMLDKVKREVSRSKSPFIQKYIGDQLEPLGFPPSWMMLEVSSFGLISKIYKNLTHEHQKDVAKVLEIDAKVLASCVQAISVLRNTCAHHSIVWNAKHTFNPRVPRMSSIFANHEQPDKVYNRLLVITLLVEKISGDSEWAVNLIKLIQGHSFVDMSAMGFPSSWNQMLLWRCSGGESASDNCRWLNHG
ncbi:MAG: hypothetical protein CMF60_05220 [Magnetococcales bacterium]|nr:hypothetical protein [Magnetococcales bacterium]